MVPIQWKIKWDKTQLDTSHHNKWTDYSNYNNLGKMERMLPKGEKNPYLNETCFKNSKAFFIFRGIATINYKFSESASRISIGYLTQWDAWQTIIKPDSTG